MKIVDITNKLTFEKDVKDAKEIFKSKMPTKLIYDDMLHFYALAVQNEDGSNIVPIKDNKAFDIIKNHEKPFKSIVDKLRDDYLNKINNKTQLGGSIGNYKGNELSKNNVIFTIFWVLSIIILSVIPAVVLKKRKLIRR